MNGSAAAKHGLSSQAKPVGRRENRAAGHAWSPGRFTIAISFSTFVATDLGEWFDSSFCT
jgi:hypothetical protein